jgi:hypothetical protein
VSSYLGELKLSSAADIGVGTEGCHKEVSNRCGIHRVGAALWFNECGGFEGELSRGPGRKRLPKKFGGT